MELGGVLGTARSPKPHGESPILSPPARLSSSAASSAGFVNRRSSVRARPGALLHSCVVKVVFFENRIAVAAPRLVVPDVGHLGPSLYGEHSPLKRDREGSIPSGPTYARGCSSIPERLLATQKGAGPNPAGRFATDGMDQWRFSGP